MGHLPSRQLSEREECIGPSIPSKDDLGILAKGIHIGCDKYFQLMWHAAQIIIVCEAFRADLAEDSEKLLAAVRFPAYGPVSYTHLTLPTTPYV